MECRANTQTYRNSDRIIVEHDGDKILPANRLLRASWIVALAACGRARSTQSLPSSHLVVLAASSLTQAFEQLGRQFEAEHPGLGVIFNFGGSQALRTQVEEGAPADVFASASPTEMDVLVTEGYVSASAPQTLLTNRLVVILAPHNPAVIEGLQDLARPGIKLVLAAPDVPVGQYAREALDKLQAPLGADFKNSVLKNVVSNEDNVKQVVTKIQLGEADAGIVYVSDAVAAPDLKTIEIPAAQNVIAQYAIAALARSAHALAARQFVAYVLSSDGQAVLSKWGFGPAGG